MACIIEENKALRPFNTFAIHTNARYYVKVDTLAELHSILTDQQYKSQRKIILGGGSNILFMQNLDALVIHINIPGIDVIKEDEAHVYLKIAAGENWHQFVTYCIEHDYQGIENLALIPGLMGAAPMQNIGAYGVELCDVFEKLEAINIGTSEQQTFTLDDCQFGYRNSIFKQQLKNQLIITNVYLRLNKTHNLNTHYAGLNDYLHQHNIKSPTMKDIYQAVIKIRQSKLPDPAKIANAGSFFKNPIIGKNLFKELKTQYPDLPHYPIDDEHVKLPAAWLIDQCDFKGYRIGDAGVHTHQALVLVNHDNASGQAIIKLSQQIQVSVFGKFHINLSPEVNII